jgi:signal transduction histidine kinase
MVYSITEDTDHNIWVESSGALSRIRDFKVEEEFPSEQVPPAFRVVADPKRGIWLGLVNGDLARYQDGRTETFHFQDAPQSRVEQVLVNPNGSVLGATAHGLVGWRNGKQMTLTTQNGLPCEITYASVFDTRGDLWIYAQCGLIKITKEELQNWWDHPDAKLEPRVFDAFDGAQPGRAPFGGATRSPDGRLWFASGVVLQTIDPDHLALNPLPPPVHIEGIVADHRNYLPRGGLRLPALTRDVEVDYTALSFVAPKKVRFRYKLVGRDTSWQDPGIRRQAFYTDLRPGKYTFRVIACNNDGLWNEEGATLEFGIAPAWFQTNWFLLFSLVSGILFALVLYRLRVGQIARTMSARFDERLAERTRLAREIHDTLLQTIQGSKMVADDALDESSDLPHMRRAMERLSGWLGQATQEGRAALNSLRNSTTQTNDLAEAFERALDDSRIQGGPEAVFVVEGTAAEMHPIARDEIYRIGYEAIRNASQHAEASHLTVHLSYSQDLVLTVSDNGKGIDPQVAAYGKDGHFGLPGMRERALRIGAKLAIVSSARSGTKIELIVPGRVIFRDAQPSWRTLFTRVKNIVGGTHPTDGAG